MKAPPSTTLYVPTTEDGEHYWRELRYTPPASEHPWMLSDSEPMREAFALLAVMKARNALEGSGLEVGWTSD